MEGTVSDAVMLGLSASFSGTRDRNKAFEFLLKTSTVVFAGIACGILAILLAFLGSIIRGAP